MAIISIAVTEAKKTTYETFGTHGNGPGPGYADEQAELTDLTRDACAWLGKYGQAVDPGGAGQGMDVRDPDASREGQAS